MFCMILLILLLLIKKKWKNKGFSKKKKLCLDLSKKKNSERIHENDEGI